MSNTIYLNGQTFVIPDPDDEGWGAQVTAWIEKVNSILNGVQGYGQAPDPVSDITFASTTKGVKLPRLSTSQRDTLTAALNPDDAGLFLYDTTLGQYGWWDGDEWQFPELPPVMTPGESGLVPAGGTADTLLAGDATWKNLKNFPAGVFDGATGSDGTAGLVPQPLGGEQLKILQASGDWENAILQGATGSLDGVRGFAPQPLIADVSPRVKVLAASGIWAEVADLLSGGTISGSLTIGTDLTVTGDVTVGDDVSIVGDLSANILKSLGQSLGFSPKITIYTSGAGNHTFQSGIRKAMVLLVGGGGGGGGGGRATSTTCANSGGGGGAGAMALFELTLISDAQILAYQVGSGGTGGAGATVNNTPGIGGNDGNPSTFADPAGGLARSVPGGSGGIGGSNATTGYTKGGDGGQVASIVGSLFKWKVGGLPGGFGLPVAASGALTFSAPGAGGHNEIALNISNAGLSPSSGVTYGCGGHGGSGNVAGSNGGTGANGANGIVVVIE